MELSDDQIEQIDNAIERAMFEHEAYDGDERCNCGVRNNMDGDVLPMHRVSVVCDAVHAAIARFT